MTLFISYLERYVILCTPAKTTAEPKPADTGGLLSVPPSTPPLPVPLREKKDKKKEKKKRRRSDHLALYQQSHAFIVENVGGAKSTECGRG